MQQINQELCTFCAGCASVCPVMAIEVHATGSRITEVCGGCGLCRRFCPVGAIADSPAGERTHEL